KIKFHTISNEVFNVKGTHFTPIEVFHMNLPVLGFRTGKFTYITDANRISEKAMEQMEGSEVIVLNALRREKHISHFNLEEAVEMLEKLSHKKAYRIHISHQLGLNDEINNELPSFIRCAYDGLSIEI